MAQSIEINGSQTVVRVPVVVRQGLQGGTRTDLLFVFHKNIYSQLYFLPVGFC